MPTDDCVDELNVPDLGIVKVGCSLRHKYFGVGIVKKIYAFSRGATVMIEFNGELKRIVVLPEFFSKVEG